MSSDHIQMPHIITREEIERRRAELQANKDQFIANANACDGAIQDCNYWLAQMPMQQLEGEVKAEKVK